MIIVLADASFHLKGGAYPLSHEGTHSSRAGCRPTRDRQEGHRTRIGDTQTQMPITTSPRRRVGGEPSQRRDGRDEERGLISLGGGCIW